MRRKPTDAQWATHYAKRAAGCEKDAEYCLDKGNMLDAKRLTRIAKNYRELEALALRKAEAATELSQAQAGSQQ